MSKKTTDAMPPLAATELTTGWLGSSLRVKGDISGIEDLLIDGAVEGKAHLCRLPDGMISFDNPYRAPVAALLFFPFDPTL
jgi:hypothetical protein